MSFETLIALAVGLVVVALALFVIAVFDHQIRHYNEYGQPRTLISKVGFWPQKAYQLAISCVFSALVVVIIAFGKKYLL